MEKKAHSRGITRKLTASLKAPNNNPLPATTVGEDVKPRQNMQLTVHSMTSRDFQQDLNAHVEVAAYQLKDKASINCFKAAITHNKHLFRGRTVLDIGCGVGVLSLFAAKAGASQVFAVDHSNVVDYTQQIVQDNGFGEVIKVIKGRVEDIELPVEKVDVIICNWLGYSLLFQSLCEEVIYARDKWLKTGGMIFPDVAKLFMAALEDNKYKNERVEWWNNVYGVNMKCLREFALSEPSFQMVQPQQMLSGQFGIKYLNLYTAKREDLKFRCKYMLGMQRSGRMDGLVTFFTVYFSKSHTPLALSTDPFSPRTRWVQTVFYFDNPVFVNAGQLFYGGIEMYSPNGDGDSNNMEVGFEMYSGDPVQLHLETEMRWCMKPHAAAVITPKNKNAQAEEIKIAENEVTAATDVAQDATPMVKEKKKEVLIVYNKKPIAEIQNQKQKRESSQKLVTIPNSIMIGDYAYPLGKRGKTAKHTKKG